MPAELRKLRDRDPVQALAPSATGDAAPQQVHRMASGPPCHGAPTASPVPSVHDATGSSTRQSGHRRRFRRQQQWADESRGHSPQTPLTVWAKDSSEDSGRHVGAQRGSERDYLRSRSSNEIAESDSLAQMSDGACWNPVSLRARQIFLEPAQQRVVELPPAEDPRQRPAPGGVETGCLRLRCKIRSDRPYSITGDSAVNHA